MPIKRNNNLCIVRKVLGTNIEIHLTEDEVRALYDELCRHSTKRHIGISAMNTVLKSEYDKFPNEHEVSR